MGFGVSVSNVKLFFLMMMMMNFDIVNIHFFIRM